LPRLNEDSVSEGYTGSTFEEPSQSIDASKSLTSVTEELM
jgi:hypothetical protein